MSLLGLCSIAKTQRGKNSLTPPPHGGPGKAHAFKSDIKIKDGGRDAVAP